MKKTATLLLSLALLLGLASCKGDKENPKPNPEPEKLAYNQLPLLKFDFKGGDPFKDEEVIAYEKKVGRTFTEKIEFEKGEKAFVNENLSVFPAVMYAKKLSGMVGNACLCKFPIDNEEACGELLDMLEDAGFVTLFTEADGKPFLMAHNAEKKVTAIGVNYPANIYGAQSYIMFAPDIEPQPLKIMNVKDFPSFEALMKKTKESIEEFENSLGLRALGEKGNDDSQLQYAYLTKNEALDHSIHAGVMYVGKPSSGDDPYIFGLFNGFIDKKEFVMPAEALKAYLATNGFSVDFSAVSNEKATGARAFNSDKSACVIVVYEETAEHGKQTTYHILPAKKTQSTELNEFLSPEKQNELTLKVRANSYLSELKKSLSLLNK